MKKIDKVVIEGFWGDKKITLKLKEDVNFLIGVNGSGKTTIINLIAAALNADFSTLDRLQFKKILIQLDDYDIKTKKCSYIEVDKSDQKTSPFPNINFKIKELKDKEPLTFILNELEEEQLIRYPNEYIIRQIRKRQGKIESDVHFKLKDLVNVTWLSIHRSTSPYRRQEERSLESTIDQKIDELSTDLVKYFSLLNRRYAEETEKFQQYIFLSLLTDESEEEFMSFVKGLDPEKEKESLRQIFNLFKLNESVYSKKLNKHFDSYKLSIDKMTKEQLIRINDFAYLQGTRRIHSVVQEWNKLIEKQNSIYSSKDTFLNVVNALLQKKQLFINERNELAVKTDNSKVISLMQLSSGEKQLIIILGAALLQQSATHIYIADEPELSLHVDWQEKLVSSLKSLNQNSQIIFATHSPDIVSTYSSGVIQIEEVIK